MSSFVMQTISSFSIKYTSLVYFNTAGTSDAIRFPMLLFPTISGLSFLTAYNLSGSDLKIIPSAYEPSTLCITFVIVSSASPL